MQSYIQGAFSELYNDDGMAVLGRGLGIQLLFSKFVQYYSLKSSKSQIVPQRLVLCINANDSEPSIRKILQSEGAEDDNLPEVSYASCGSCTYYLPHVQFYSRLLITK
jgi:hypothetical protein